MEHLVSKIDAAVHQLDWAITLFLDSEAYIPAITLAGAAEEILGQTLQDRAVFAQLKAKFAVDTGLAESGHWLGGKCHFSGLSQQDKELAQALAEPPRRRDDYSRP